MKKRHITGAVLLLLLSALLIAGCEWKKQTEGEKKDLSYTVVPEKDLSKELLKLIEERKETAYRFSYVDEKYLYIVEGFGEKSSGGYSVHVDQLYLMNHAVYFNALLEGPGEEAQTGIKSYPYLVVKLERREEAVVFL